MTNNLKYSKKHPKVFQYKNKSGLFWGYRTTYYDNFNERHESQKRGFKTENEAYKAYLNTESDIASQNTNLVKDKNITFKQLGEMFLESRLPYLKKTTAQNYKLNINKIISLVGDIKIQKMTPMIYQKKVINYYVDQGLMKNTILNVHNRMMMLMNIAVDNDIILKNNLNRVVIPDTGKIEKRIMSVEELKKFNKQLEKEPFLTQLLFYTLEQTGLRQGELLGLKWKNIDIDNNKLHIELTRDYLGLEHLKLKIV